MQLHPSPCLLGRCQDGPSAAPRPDRPHDRGQVPATHSQHLIRARTSRSSSTYPNNGQPAPKLILEDFNLEAAERRLCIATLELAGNIVGAAQLLGITRHALKRRMIKLRIDRPGTVSPGLEASP